MITGSCRHCHNDEHNGVCYNCHPLSRIAIDNMKAVLKPCPLCGADNLSGEVNVRYFSSVSGGISTTMPNSHTFQNCQMVRCCVCGCMVIDPNDAVKLWNEKRGRHSPKQYSITPSSRLYDAAKKFVCSSRFEPTVPIQRELRDAIVATEIVPADKGQSHSPFDDASPITKEWLLAQGFVEVESPMGGEYKKHLQKGCLNIWDYNDTGDWLFNEYDSLAMRTRGQLKMLAHLLKVEVGDVVLPADRLDPRHVEAAKEIIAGCPESRWIDGAAQIRDVAGKITKHVVKDDPSSDCDTAVMFDGKMYNAHKLRTLLDGQLAIHAAMVSNYERELSGLRALFPQILTELGNGAGCSADCSLEFLKNIPTEVRLVVGQLKSRAEVAERGMKDWQKLANEGNELIKQKDVLIREAQAALSGRTVSCVCGGQEKLDALTKQHLALITLSKWLVATCYAHVKSPGWDKIRQSWALMRDVVNGGRSIPDALAEYDNISEEVKKALNL